MVLYAVFGQQCPDRKSVHLQLQKRRILVKENGARGGTKDGDEAPMLMGFGYGLLCPRIGNPRKTVSQHSAVASDLRQG